MPTPAPARPPKNKAPAVRELFKIRAYDELRSRLSDCYYEPGTLLSERQLAAELGMSKTPVKAALERLEMEGYITVSPQSGIIVRALTSDEIADIYEIRIAVEGYVIKTITGRITADQLALWEGTLTDLEQVTAQPDKQRQKLVELDEKFHSLPHEFLGNGQILQTMQQLSVKNRMVINSVFATLPDRAHQSLREHREIIDTVRSGNAVRASELMESHIRAGHDILCKARNQ